MTEFHAQRMLDRLAEMDKTLKRIAKVLEAIRQEKAKPVCQFPPFSASDKEEKT